MADYIQKIRTTDGDKQIDYGALANKPLQYITSLDEANLVNLRDLATGSYVLYGYFRPFAGSPNTLTIDTQLVNVVRKSAGSHVLIFSTLNSIVNFLEILVDSSNSYGFTYTRTDIKMLDLHGLIAKVGDLSGLQTTAKDNLVAAINEAAASGGDSSDCVKTVNGVAPDESGNVQLEFGSGLPSGGTAGQVLTMGEDGKPVWADGIPSAEGVMF